MRKYAWGIAISIFCAWNSVFAAAAATDVPQNLNRNLSEKKYTTLAGSFMAGTNSLLNLPDLWDSPEWMWLSGRLSLVLPGEKRYDESDEPLLFYLYARTIFRIQELHKVRQEMILHAADLSLRLFALLWVFQQVMLDPEMGSILHTNGDGYDVSDLCKQKFFRNGLYPENFVVKGACFGDKPLQIEWDYVQKAVLLYLTNLNKCPKRIKRMGHPGWIMRTRVGIAYTPLWGISWGDATDDEKQAMFDQAYMKKVLRLMEKYLRQVIPMIQSIHSWEHLNKIRGLDPASLPEAEA